MKPNGKYRPFPPVQLVARQWPSRVITHAPAWCSVDLRDGNQALQDPMIVEQKVEMFMALVAIGFKEIEVGFPAASGTEYLFVRRLIEENLIPDDVAIQVLVQCREELIQRTVESLKGAKRAIIHVYNSTSPAQRKIVFGLEKPDIMKLAVRGVQWVKDYLAKYLSGTEVRLEYSPESFSATELDFALQVCEAVMDVWQPTSQNKIILNLPATVELATPNVFADQVEWFCRNISHRESVVIGVHTHNDRGTGNAASELALLAGAERVEGTLFGNGERTGNADIVTLALNLYSQGIDPELDFSDIESIVQMYVSCTGMTVPARYPYAGKFVFTAFSGSHQDAIKKGLKAREKELAVSPGAPWEMPYLSIDPADIGRRYDEVIRVNGQSGKGGITYLLEKRCGILLPRGLQKEFGAIAGEMIDSLGREVSADELKQMLWLEYVNISTPRRLDRLHTMRTSTGVCCRSTICCSGQRQELASEGNGPIDAFIHSLRNKGLEDVQVKAFHADALDVGSGASEIVYVRLQFPNGELRWGIGVDTDSGRAPILAVISALNRA